MQNKNIKVKVCYDDDDDTSVWTDDTTLLEL